MRATGDDNVGARVPVLAAARINISHGDAVKLQDVRFPELCRTKSVDEVVDVPELIDAVACFEARLILG